MFYDRHTRVDPSAEISRIRHSLNLLESHILQTPALRHTAQANTSAAALNALNQRSATQRVASGSRRANDFKDPNEAEASASQSKLSEPPGMLGQSDPSGFYNGPTSTLSHLMTVSLVVNVRINLIHWFT